MAWRWGIPATESDLLSGPVRENFDALGSFHYGPTPPAQPWRNGMPWIDSSNPSNVTEKRYIDGAWRVIKSHLEGQGALTGTARIARFTVQAPSPVWILRHDFEFRPVSVQVMDLSYRTIEAQVDRLDDNVVQISFSAPQSGHAVVIGGDPVENQGQGLCTPRAAGEYDPMPMPHGCLTILEKDASTGEVYRFEEAKNTVVYGARQSMAHCCANNAVSDWAVSQMAFGTGGHVPGDINTPVPPNFTDTALEASIIVKNVTVSFPTDNSVLFTGTLESGDANGNDITEAGLVCGNGTLFARKTFKAFHKSAGRVIEFSWQIFFEVADNGCSCGTSPSSCGSVRPFDVCRFGPAAGGETVVPITGFEIIPGQHRLLVFRNGRAVLANWDFTETATAIEFTPAYLPAGLEAGDYVDMVWLAPGVC